MLKVTDNGVATAGGRRPRPRRSLAAGFVMPNGSPCKNPPPKTESGSDTIYVVSLSGTTWTPTSSPNPSFPTPPTVPSQVFSHTNLVGCPAPQMSDYQVKYVPSVQADIQNGNWHYSGCGASVTATSTETVQSPTTVTVSFGANAGVAQGNVSFSVDSGTSRSFTSQVTAGPAPGIEFRIMRRTPNWYLNTVAYYRTTGCYTLFPGPYGPWKLVSTKASPDFTQLPGTVWDVESECCGG